MNLEILHPRAAVPLVLAAMVAMPTGMFWVFKKKGWL
jgi:magnesium transporter